MCYTVYTDGSASPNPGPGGAGAIMLKNDLILLKITHIGGYTTNNKMELYALIMIFPHLPKNKPVTLYTDSKYVQTGLSLWINSWIKNNWLTSTKKPVKNQQLWKQLWKLREQYPKVTIKWVKAHNGNKWNDYADTLANIGTTRSKESKKTENKE